MDQSVLIKLTPEQQRVMGVLLEKEVTTPEQYPLSLNGLTLGCNQKSSREPLMNLSESKVQEILKELAEKKLTLQQNGSSSRVIKYGHRFCNTQFSDLQLSPQQKAIVCLLLLRGPQTPGELRTRSNRLAEFASVTEVERSLEQLQNLNGEQLVIQLPRQAGKRECRYAHQFTEQVAPETGSSEGPQGQWVNPPLQAHGTENKRIEILEQQIQTLHGQVAELRKMILRLSK